MGGQETGEIDECDKRYARFADLHACAGDRVQHPRRYNDDIARRRFDMRRSTAITLVDALATDLLPKQRMMRIMDGYKLTDMGRMTLRW